MKKNNSLITLGAMAAIAAIVIFIGRLGWFKPLGTLAQRALAPIAGLGYRIADIVHPGKNEGKTAGELVDELGRTQAENRRLMADNARLAAIEQENASLRDYLHFIQEKKIEYIMAGVVARGRPGDSWQSQQTLTLNRGQKDGLAVGMPIIDAEGILLGRITAVSDRSAEACLLFDASCRIAVGLQGQEGTLGILQSDLNLTTKVDFIGQNKTLSEGQPVVTSGLEDHMPAGLVVGTVSTVIKQGNELWQHAVISPLGNFDDIRVVAVIK